MQMIMNEVSIIINGVRYDTDTARYTDNECDECDLKEYCSLIELYEYSCYAMIGPNKTFKKSDKKFEK